MVEISRLFGRIKRSVIAPESNPLDPPNAPLFGNGLPENLAELEPSSRLDAIERNGDTPLHVAAREGDLASCDLFIRAGGNPRALNDKHQTPADVAHAAGHDVVAQLLLSLITKPSDANLDETLKHSSDIEAQPYKTEPAPNTPAIQAPTLVSAGTADDIDGMSFEAEVAPEDFYGRVTSERASGTFVAFASLHPIMAADESEDWNIDLSPAQIVGEGIGSEVPIAPTQGGEHDFLKVRSRGRRSIKRAMMQPGTRLSINPDFCRAWAEGVLEKGWFNHDDMETLISSCTGNGDPDDLRINLQRTLEAGGFESFDEPTELNFVRWEYRTNVSVDELSEAIEATFSREMRLPGTQRFDIDKSNEARLIDPVVRAGRELLLGILSCEPAIRVILSVVSKVLNGSVEASFVSMKPIVVSRLDDAGTAAFRNAGEVLRTWNAGGRVMDGRRRREALEALEALDLTLVFQKAMVSTMAKHEKYVDDSLRLDAWLSSFELATERLVCAHIPYVRRFASRHVDAGEDPEDVFQVAFMGLQRATRRFDPERGHRFIIYATFWINQFLTRWRADEGSLVRIPVHRHDKLTKLDRTIAMLEARSGRHPLGHELAAELGWDEGDVHRLLRIPRHWSAMDDIEERVGMLTEPVQEISLCQGEMVQVVAELLGELPERQANIIRMRFGINCDDEMTLEAIGKIYGVTRERVRQIEAKAIRHLSHPSRARRLQALIGN